MIKVHQPRTAVYGQDPFKMRESCCKGGDLRSFQFPRKHGGMHTEACKHVCRETVPARHAFSGCSSMLGRELPDASGPQAQMMVGDLGKQP